MTWRRLLVPFVLVVGLIAAVLLVRGWVGKPTEVERRVDSTLQSVPAWRDTVAAREAVLAKMAREARRLARISDSLERRADSAEARADSLQRHATGLAEIPSGITPSDSVGRLSVALQAQKEAAAQFQVTVASLKSLHVNDTLRLNLADERIEQQRQDLAGRDRRIDDLTKDLSDLRAEGKNRGKFLGFLPKWTDEALLVIGGAALGYSVGSAVGKS